MLTIRNIDDSDALFNRPSVQTAFKWWYIDVLNSNGDGCVCIFSEGLPFLPASNTPSPQRYAVNIVVYQNWKESFYLLQEYPETEVQFSSSISSPPALSREEVWKIGQHQFTRRIENQMVFCDIQLQSTLTNGEPHAVQGNISISGPLLSPQKESSRYASEHQWIPVTTHCTATVSVETADSKSSFTGQAYHDSNISTSKLNDLSIKRWWWARITLEDQTWIVYLVDSEEDNLEPIWIVASVSSDGQWQEHDVESLTVDQESHSLYGLRIPANWTITLSSGTVLYLKKRNWIDDSPFYQRVIVQLTIGDQQAFGFMEHVVPNKLETPWQQPFIRMKTHYRDNPGSFFSSLFTGTTHTRWSRQLSKCNPFRS